MKVESKIVKVESGTAKVNSGSSKAESETSKMEGQCDLKGHRNNLMLTESWIFGFAPWSKSSWTTFLHPRALASTRGRYWA